MPTASKLAVLDFGGQYAHLITARIRSLGAYCEIVSPTELDTRKAKREYAGLVFSGGPNSVYEADAPRCDPGLYDIGLPLLAICYGHQLLVQEKGGRVKPAKNPEYGPAQLTIKNKTAIFAKESLERRQTVWMSHGDEVQSLPPNFEVLAETPDCPYAAVGDLGSKLFALQFHPEVQESEGGMRLLSNFIQICGLSNSWKLSDFLQAEQLRVQKQVGKHKVFFLLSGGVDSSVAFALLARSLPPEHLLGLHIDTGFMRRKESHSVIESLSIFGAQVKSVDASREFYSALKEVVEPEKKRQVIGELFLKVQKSVSKDLGLNPAEWYLGQGTIYPDQIESGSSKNSERIKTHHNRVAGIETLLKAGRIVEPISSLYKDEVRELGQLLGLPHSLLQRHPFPGPGLAVRCLCIAKKEAAQKTKLQLEEQEDWKELQEELKKEELFASVLPLRSVGVQGDKRSYRHCLSLFYKKDKDLEQKLPDWPSLLEKARQIINRFEDFNRVLLHLGALKTSVAIRFEAQANSHLSPERIGLLQEAESVVDSFLKEKKIYDDIWQFPVVLLPLAPLKQCGNALVLRPVCSTDAMTASVYTMRPKLLWDLEQRLKNIEKINAVFYDLTSKPPGTIEWE